MEQVRDRSRTLGSITVLQNRSVFHCTGEDALRIYKILFNLTDNLQTIIKFDKYSIGELNKPIDDMFSIAETKKKMSQSTPSILEKNMLFLQM